MKYNIAKQQFLSGTENHSKYPSLENLFPMKSFSLTVNPCPVTELKIRSTYQVLWKEILPLLNGSVKLYTELSTQNQNVHYHGMIVWQSYLDISKFYNSIEEIKKLCQFEIDQLNDPDQWWPYIMKQCPYMDALCHYSGVPNLIKYNNNKKNHNIPYL